VVGSTSHVSGTDPALLKLSSTGTVQWVKEYYSVTGFDSARDVRQTPDGGYIFVGDWNDRTVLVIKVSSTGGVQWAKDIKHGSVDSASSVLNVVGGGYLVACDLSGLAPQFTDVGLLKFDSNGVLEWAKAFGGTGNDDARSIKPTSDGGYLIGGNTTSFGASLEDILVMKVSSTAVLQWARVFGGTDGELLGDMTPTSDGGCILVVNTMSYGVSDWGTLIVKMSSTGTIQWAKILDGEENDFGSSIDEIDTGGYLLVGSSSSFGVVGYKDMIILKLSGSGSVDWARLFGGEREHDSATDGEPLSGGGYIVAGPRYYVKLDASGNIPDCPKLRNLSVALEDVVISPITPSVTESTASVTVEDASPTARDLPFTEVPVCPCTDLDGDGYYVEAACAPEDCDDDSSDDPGTCATCQCGEAGCEACAKCINPGALEGPPGDSDCSDGIDNDCDVLSDAADWGCQEQPPSCAGTAAGSTLGASRVYASSDMAKHMVWLVLPVATVIGLLLRRRKR